MSATGQLNRRVQIQRRDAQSDGYGGGLADTWSNVLACWASVEPLNGRELIAAQGQQSAVSVEVLIRYRQGILPGMRAVYQGRKLHIEAVIDQGGRHMFLLLQCSEGVKDG
ncbi:phage head closure protein [Chitinimonas sp.]|uniref:phage head closure protein n=1 Tax=Chitinimonas sp. TaxID=1934313 RepID=UPI0035B09333